ncbi:hypothetical protein GCM10023156_10430 [Novipirellula rosea]|uniref:CRISPR-associated nuclease/helicase Cas3 domain-containing protein n=1 Tax=Novipirellula rosea TaxID=1031540 RepID=A0ABP8MBL0_9BACT
MISTQLIEAGVDIDFPRVFRAMGPLDSIVQAAGRCNREGKLTDATGKSMLGEVVVFRPADAGLPMGIYADATSLTEAYISDPDMLGLDPELFERYFSELYQYAETDRGIQQLRQDFAFRSVARDAKVISDDTVSVVVPYRRSIKAIARIRKSEWLDYKKLRKLQRYMVNMRYGQGTMFQQLVAEGRIQPILPEANIFVLDDHCYDIQRGVVFQGLTPEELIL